MELHVLDEELSVCKLNSLSGIDLHSELFFIGRTNDELSLVCPTDVVPKNVLKRDDGWKAFRICGELDFSLIGILSKISTILANNGVGIFAVSTFDTDYILVKKDSLQKAMDCLKEGGYVFI